MVVSKIFYFYPHPWGKWSNLTNTFQMGWDHQLETDNYIEWIWGYLQGPPQNIKKDLSNALHSFFLWIWAPVRCWDVATFETLPCVLSFEKVLFLCWCEGWHHQKGWILWRQREMPAEILTSLDCWQSSDCRCCWHIGPVPPQKNTRIRPSPNICEYFSSKKLQGPASFRSITASSTCLRDLYASP